MAVTERDIYDEIAPDLVTFATVLVGPDHAPGVVSRVVTRALNRSGGLAGLDTPKTYLMKAVLNEATGVKRRRSHPQIHPDGAVDSGIPEVDVEVGNVDNLVTELPALQRAAAYLVTFLDYSLTEGAEVMGKRPGSVRRYLQLARKNLAALDDDRIDEVFRRIIAATPDAPALSDLQERRPMRRFKAWMAAAAAIPLVLIVASALGIFGGGESAGSDENTIDYVKLEYSATANPVCEGGEIIDNGGFDEATIEVWGPNTDHVTLMVATFPDGSTERMITEGEDPFNPERAWGIDPSVFEEETGFRNVRCSNLPGREVERFGFLSPPYQPGFSPNVYLKPPPGFETWDEAYDKNYETTLSELNGNAVTVHSQTVSISPDGEYHIEFYVSLDEPDQLLGHRYEWTMPEQGSLNTEMTVVDLKTVDADSVSFSTEGMFFIGRPGVEILEEGEIPRDCPVTIPSQGFTPPDGYPATPSGDRLWFGKDELWTVLSNDGSYEGGPRRSVWWSVNFTDPGVEPEPDISVTWTLRNSGIPVRITNDHATNGSTGEDGLFMIAGTDPDITGCWEVTAIYNGASLSYIYYNPDGQDDPLSVTAMSLSVIGMTAESAWRTLESAGFRAHLVDANDPSFEVCDQAPRPGIAIPEGSTIELRTAPPGECSTLMDATGTNERCLEYLPPEEEFVVVVFFNCGDGEHPNLRPVGRGPAQSTAPDASISPIIYAMTHLLTGPTATERADGFGSSFSEQSAGSLLAANLQDGHLNLNFTEGVTVDNASTATGSTFFLAELYANAFQFEEVENVEFQVNGSCEAFWEFLQAGPVCNVLDRAGWEQMQSQ